MGSLKPDVVNPGWVGVTLRAAIPLALLAACQTLTFLTGGIDLSVGAVASMSGFVVATLVGGQGLAVALIVALAIARPRRVPDRRRRRRVPGPPADHDPGHEPRRPGPGQRLAARHGPDRGGRAGGAALTLGSGTVLTVLPNSLLVFVPDRGTHPAASAAHRLWPAAVRDRRQPGRLPPVGSPGVAGPDRAVHDLGDPRGHRRIPRTPASRTSPACRSSIPRSCRRSRRR